MREKFAQNSLSFILKYNNYEGKKLDKIKYGLESFYSFVTKTSAIIIMAIALGIFKEALLLMLFYTILRIFAFGLHASSNLSCWIISIIVYSVLPMLAKSISIPQIPVVFIFSISILSFLFFAPADTEKRPLINAKKRKISKLLSLSIVTILIFISYWQNNAIVTNLICFALMIESFCINPLIYKIFKQPYANYKTYKKTV